MSTRPRVLSLLGCYWPGNEATGPSQSFDAFSQAFGQEMDLKVVALDNAVETHQGWAQVGLARRALLSNGPFGAKGLRRLITKTPHDLLILNGFHDRDFTLPALLLRRAGLIPRRPVLLSPRGEFAQGALSLKSRRKHEWLRLVRLLGLARDIWFHATAPHERRDIEALNLPCRGILDAPVPRQIPPAPETPPLEGGPLRLVFLGRITPVKNLHIALEVLAKLSIPVQFDIFGPVTDSAYWAACQRQIAALPTIVNVTLCGVLAHDVVVPTLAGYDLFFLPTKGENFGHAINEALSACVPVLISDTTPWRDLHRANAGWDLPLSDVSTFARTIENFARLNSQDRTAMRRDARCLAETAYKTSGAYDATRAMLLTAMAGNKNSEHHI